jgi:hypothetical protein
VGNFGNSGKFCKNWKIFENPGNFDSMKKFEKQVEI